MNRPTVSVTTERLVDLVGPALISPDVDHDWALTKLLDVLATNVDLIDQIYRPATNQRGFDAFLDPARCPAAQLPALAGWVGVTITPDMSPTQQRTAIANRPALRRGSPAAIAGAVQATLTGGQRVTITETGAHTLTCAVYRSQMPDQTVTEQALTAACAAWVQPTLTVLAGQTWAELQTKHATWAAVTSRYGNWAELLEDV